jgi:hypothetical protein
MTTEGQISQPLSPGRMLAITAGALVVASAIVFGAILPAEFNLDPLGLGKLTGLNRLWAPRDVPFDITKSELPLAREYPSGFRSDTIEIPLNPDGSRQGGDHADLRMERGRYPALDRILFRLSRPHAL